MYLKLRQALHPVNRFQASTSEEKLHVFQKRGLGRIHLHCLNLKGNYIRGNRREQGERK